MVKWNTIKELQNIFIDKYIHSELLAELEKACSEEYELKRDYNGRQILELLQNVDDVYNETNITNKTKNASVKITYKNNILEVGNTGTSFTAETIERLCLGRASTKSSNNIGNKGTGFRSLLNDAEWIEIHSGNFHLRFSEKYTQSLFEQYKDEPLIKSQYNDWKKKDYPLCFPIMNCPEEIEPIKSEFDTFIRIKIKEENNDKDTSINNQLQQPLYKSLLFLPNINKIIVETDLDVKKFEKICENDVVLLQESNNEIHQYFVQRKNINLDRDKIATLIIAVPLEKNYDFSTETLYCYFPIRNFPTPIHALIHAPFQTNNSRDDIPNDEKQINKELLKQCLDFAKEVAEKIAIKKIASIDLPIITLTPNDNFNGKVWGSSYFNLKNYYIDLLANAKLLPTVNNELISIEDKPKYIERNFPTEFKGVLFSDLLVSLQDDVYKFIIDLANKCNYQEDDLKYSSYKNIYTMKEKISNLSKDFDIPTSVSIFLWWSDYSKKSNGMPYLLKNTNGNYIKEHDRVYLPTDTNLSILPESLNWVNLCILHQDYVDELIKQIQGNYLKQWEQIRQNLAEKTANKRILDKYSDEYFPIKFKEQSSSDLIIEEINKQIDTKEKSINFINWFYENYKDKFKENSTLYNINYNLIARDNQVKSAKQLFFGIEYGKDLSEKIFANTNYYAIASLATIFTGKKEDEDSFVEFLNKCGVSFYPQIKDMNFDYNEIDYAFANYLKKKYNYQNNIYHIKVKSINNLQTILNRLTTDEIVRWLKEYIELHNLMLSNEKSGYFSQKSNTTYYYIDANEYIKYIFNNTNWISIDGNKYKPNQIVKYSKLANKISEIYGISETELIYLLDKNIVLYYNLDFKNSMSEFPDETIKKIINELPNVDLTGEISRRLYEDITKDKKGITPSYSVSDFKLLCCDGKFHLNKDIKYAQRKIQKNSNNKSILIDIQPKRNTETIKNWFGVEKYKTNLILTDYKSLENTESFENEIKEIKIATLSTMSSETNTYIDKLKHLTIIPCLYIHTNDTENNNEEINLEDYNYIKDNGKYLIKVPQQYNNVILEQSVEFSNNIIEIIEDFVSPQIDKNLVGRLISSSISNKKYIIEDQYGIDRWNYVQELLFQQNTINEIIIKYFNDNGLGQEKLNYLLNIDFSRNLSNDDYYILKNACFEINKDICDINNISKNINIDIRNNIKSEFDKYKEDQYEKFRVAYYDFAQGKAEIEREFLNICNKYKCYNLKEIDNSINQKVENIFKDIIKKNFNNICLDNLNQTDINKIYNNNYLNTIKILNCNYKDFDDFIKKHQNLNSILYFEIPNNIKKLFTEYIQNVNGNDDNNDINKVKEIQIQEIRLTPRKNNVNNNNKIMSENSQKYYEKKSETNEQNGKTAEEIAYIKLKEDFPNIVWHSKNSKIPADKNNAPVNVVCDMWNIDNNGNKTFFEIKSATNEFEMSINEYNSMKDYYNDYVIVLVDIRNNRISKHKFNELEPLKQVSKYVFTFNQVKK